MNLNDAKFIASYGLPNQLPKSQNKEIVFMGRSNVGKSTLINLIFNKKKLARVSGEPGKTATINFYRVKNVDFIDLPGYGYAKKSKTQIERFKELIDGFFEMDRRVAIIVLLIDMRHKPSVMDIDTINFLIDAQFPFMINFTKADKLNKTNRENIIKEFKREIPYYNDITKVITSSKTKEGIDDLKWIIKDAISDCY